MVDIGLEQQILEKIKTLRTLPLSFTEITQGFEAKFSDFDPLNNCFKISDYFGPESGQVSTTKKLLKDGRIKENWLENYQTKKGKTKNDFKGIYIFINDTTPFYVGISKGVIGRIFQHVKGHNHNTSTLAYNIGLRGHELLTGQKHQGQRKELNFKTEVAPVKEFLLKQKIAFLNIKNDEELYLFEIFCSMQLRTPLNTFHTH